jgi:adenylosuccinate synthase
MPVDVVVGAQWGDEGKGKIVDLLSENVDIVARYQGGPNAGHTVVLGDKEYVFHMLPAGILHENVTCVIGNGAVIDPVALMEEIRQITDLGISIKGRFLISHNAHLIMPYHKLLDKLSERGENKIGTTGRGIGPSYIDKFMRTGIKIVDLLDRRTLRSKLKRNIQEKNILLQKVYASAELDVDKITREYEEFDQKIDDYVTDTALYLNNALKEGKKVLAEGAQGALLDVDHGTYPFVTSSNPTSGGACTGLGIPPTAIRSVIGVVKAYTTRVGHGPFPTELTNELGSRLREIGDEYGATTGRPRRCGWFDAVSTRYAAMINGIERIAITKLDVLSHLDEIKICTGYEYQGKMLKTFPTDVTSLDKTTPVYKTFAGWKTSIADVTEFDALPANARQYVEALAEFTGTRVWIVSVGAQRRKTIMVTPS